MADSIVIFILLGFCAQMIDGALGMAYGVFLTTTLTFLGIPVAHASASVHFSEMFTTAVSGLSHFKFKNVDLNLLKKLAPAGVLGGITGALILSHVNGAWIKPFVSFYLFILGIRIIIKGLRQLNLKKITRKIIPLGFIGGFFDAIGGGGWGPIVTSTLVARGNNPRKTIGTVNLAEFFITAAQSFIFYISIGMGYWKIVLGLIIGGSIAAPLAAYVCHKINMKILMLLVGGIIVVTNIFSLYKEINFFIVS